MCASHPQSSLPVKERKVAIVQSSYIPWKGYFDIVGMVNLFVLLDDVQYTVRDWRSRNRIKTPNGSLWLTVPCGTHRHRLIHEVRLTDHAWQREHWEKISFCYKKARFFSAYRDFFQSLYLGRTWTNLSEMNQHMIRRISHDLLGMKTEFLDSRDLRCTGRKMQRILEILDKLGGVTEYLSGPSAREYLEPDEFRNRGIKLSFMDYSGYPEYPQLYSPPFVHEVSVIDLIFNVGPEAPKYLKSFHQQQ